MNLSFNVFCALLLFFPSCLRAGILPDNPFSNDASGTTAAVFLKNPAGARAQALGGSGLALSGAESVFWNPAGLAGAVEENGKALTLGYERMLETSYRNTLGYAKSVKGLGVLGAGVIFVSQSAMEGYSAAGDSTGGFKPYDMAVSGLFARRLGRADFGLAVKFIRSKLFDESGNSAAADAGLIFRNALDLGGSMADVALSVRNFGLPMKIGSQSDPLPLELGVGFLWHFYSNFIIVLDGKAPVDHSPYLTAGGEWSVPFRGGWGGALRAGYNFKNMQDLGAMGAVSAGGGIKFEAFNLDYAWVPFGDLGATHRITMGIKYGGTGEDSEAAGSRDTSKSGLPQAGPVVAVSRPAAVRGPVIGSSRDGLPEINARPVVAVARISAARDRQNDAETVMGWLMDALSGSDTINLINPGNRNKILTEQAEQLALCSENCEKNARRFFTTAQTEQLAVCQGNCKIFAGRLLKADKIVSGSISTLEYGHVLHLEMADVATGRTEFSGSEIVSGTDGLKGAAYVLADGILNVCGNSSSHR